MSSADIDTWTAGTFGDVFTRREERAKAGDPLLSVTTDWGVVPQGQSGRRDVSSDDKTAYRRVFPGDIVYNTMRMWQGVSARSSHFGIVSPAYTVCSPKEGFDSRFLAYVLKLPKQVSNFRASSQGLVSDTWNLRFGTFVGLPVSWPALLVQRRIATILDTVDEAIRSTERVIAKLEQTKQGVLQDLLTRGLDKDGHPRDPNYLTDMAIGPIPRSWSVAPLGECVASTASITYGIVQAGPHVEGGVPYIRTGNMSGYSLSREGLLCTSPRIARSYARSAVRAGEIVCAIRATVGKVLPVPPELDGANLTQGTARISPLETVDGGFLLWALRSHAVQRQFALATKGTTFSEITLGQLRQLLVPLPDTLREQRLIGIRMTAADEQVRCEQSYLDKLHTLKQGLMDDLLTGRVRVNVAEEASV